MKRLSIILAALLMSGSAMSASIPDRVRTVRKLDAICRGSVEMNATVEYACDARTAIAKSLYKDGLCYGKNSQVGADHEWHVCTRDSIRLSNR
jgi:uncharacterized membrane protein